MANKGGFSWKRATGVSKAKHSFSRKTGIPTSKSGLQRKVGKAATGGCLTLIIQFVSIMALLGFAISVLL